MDIRRFGLRNGVGMEHSGMTYSLLRHILPALGLCYTNPCTRRDICPRSAIRIGGKLDGGHPRKAATLAYEIAGKRTCL